VAKTDANLPKGWERLTMIIHYRRGEGGWVAQEAYPAPVAQQNFWNDAIPMIHEIETAMTDDGWQPIGEHGPACVELEAYKSAEGQNPLAMALGAVASYGTSLLFARSWKFTVKSITLEWRRPMMEEGTSEEEFHMWFNTKTGELERWEFDSATNQWVPMDVDEDGNWTRKQQPMHSPAVAPKPVLSPVESVHPPTTPSVLPLEVTDEEGRILMLLAKGLSNPEIAKRLNKSPVHTSLMTTDLLNRFEAETKDELVRIAKEKGFLPAD
jgi:DNA-binding CsgD family transcriptional regulator